MIRGVCKAPAGLAKSRAAAGIAELRAVDWPDVFAFPPRVGDWVRSLDGKEVAAVVRVTHCISNSPDGIGAPTIEVEVRL